MPQVLFSSSQKEIIFLVPPVEFSSTFSLSLKEDQLRKKVNRRQKVKPGMLNSLRPSLGRAQVVLFRSLFIILDLVRVGILDGFIGKEYHLVVLFASLIKITFGNCPQVVFSVQHKPYLTKVY